ncbi:hypothetical protein Nepgr_015033 [Nepenthes gracilis]|uniref:Serine aminopeptidase S33 domain-containing protein n=1 Tax=Nepenthes gracilis TaxID=150966 RepID=A0AAD3SLG7_NEPGR|nr:hypothetical protein Nepgr_015033 [Nepenthes gracilis]
MASTLSFSLYPNLRINIKLSRMHAGRAFSSLESGESSVLSTESVSFNGSSVVKEEEKIGSLINGGNGHLSSIVQQKKRGEEVASEKLEVLWDDGFGTTGMKDYLDVAKEMIKPDGGPPRWFCPVECGRPLKDSPALLFLPGLDGVGLGLMMHHKPLGRVFEVRCLHIPVNDRTPFEGLVKYVEQTVRNEHASSPNKPIYLVGDSFGGCLALAVAARNPYIDLVLILANPATSFARSPLQPVLPLLGAIPDEFHITVPYLLSFIMGEPLKMAMVNVDPFPPTQMLRNLSENLTALLPRISVVADIIPKDTLNWKLKLLKSASAHANSRLHAVKAEVLVLASGKDNMLPSGDEAKRLSSSLKNCKVRYFKDNGHTLLLEDGISLLTIIKGTSKYRRLRRFDYVSDFLPPSMWEYKYICDQNYGFVRLLTSPVMLSTLSDGKIVKGLDGVPTEGPVLYVGYHMLMGLELSNLSGEFLKEKKICLRGLGHPDLFSDSLESPTSTFAFFDYIRLFGTVPVSPTSLFRLLSNKAHILLYPGGAREALHRKGEAYKLFWPDQPEFVRMAAQFGATIVPFGVVGEDDLLELVLDYDDQKRIPILKDYISQRSHEMNRVRAGMIGETDNKELTIPVVAPKMPGRLYYLFARPIETKGKKEMLKDRQNANELYLHIKSEVESSLAYLIKKREEDPYRNIIDRTIYRAVMAPLPDVPTFPHEQRA